MGTPDFAARILKSLLDNPLVTVPCVYTQPDKPAGRGKKVLPPPVKSLALEHGVEVRQPLSLKPAEELDALRALQADFLVVAAYGMILPQGALDAAKYAPINVHTSILPAYRGAAPVQRALMDGQEITGVSLMRMEAGLDTGPVYRVLTIPTGRETSGSLLEKLADLANPALAELLPAIAAGEIAPVPQEGEACYAAKLKKEEGEVDFNRPVRLVDCYIRGVTPAPGAHATLVLEQGEVPVVIEEALPVEEPVEAPGLVLAKKGELKLTCEGGSLRVTRLKPQGKKSMDAASFLNGLRLGGGQLMRVGTIAPVKVGE